MTLKKYTPPPLGQRAASPLLNIGKEFLLTLLVSGQLPLPCLRFGTDTYLCRQSVNICRAKCPEPVL